MPTDADSLSTEPTRAEIDAIPRDLLLEFGASWCSHCISAQPLVARALDARPTVRHVRIEDGRGRRLGRSFGVKRWPTLVHLRDGVEIARVERPTSVGDVESLFTVSRATASTGSPQGHAPHSDA